MCNHRSVGHFMTLKYSLSLKAVEGAVQWRDIHIEKVYWKQFVCQPWRYHFTICVLLLDPKRDRVDESFPHIFYSQTDTLFPSSTLSLSYCHSASPSPPSLTRITLIYLPVITKGNGSYFPALRCSCTCSTSQAVFKEFV